MKKRQMRLADEIRDIIATCIMQELSDPRIHEAVITHVRLSPDLQVATVYFRFYGEKHTKDEILRGLESCRGFLRGTMSKSLALRRVPELRFFYDESVEEGARIEGLLAKIHKG